MQIVCPNDSHVIAFYLSSLHAKCLLKCLLAVGRYFISEFHVYAFENTKKIAHHIRHLFSFIYIPFQVSKHHWHQNKSKQSKLKHITNKLKVARKVFDKITQAENQT